MKRSLLLLTCLMFVASRASAQDPYRIYSPVQNLATLFTELLGGRQDLVTTVNAIDLSVSQYTTFVTVGVTDHFDVSAAIKFVTNDISIRSNATIQRIGTTNPLTHFYRQVDGSIGNERVF